MTAALTAEGLHTYYGKSHILHGVSLSVAEGRITVLDQGAMLAQGTPQEIAANEAVQAAYLGKAA